MASDYDTRVTLLARLKEGGGERDWQDFYRQYARFIMSVAMRYGLPQRDAEDVLQETMMEMMRVLARFEYDRSKGSFRGFLRTIVTRKAGRFRTRRPDHLSLDQQTDQSGNPLLDLIADENIVSPLEGLDLAWKGAVLEEAAHRLLEDGGVSPGNMTVMRALLAGDSMEEIAAATGKKPNAIYQVKHRVQQKLREAVAELLEATE